MKKLNFINNLISDLNATKVKEKTTIKRKVNKQNTNNKKRKK